MRRGPHAHAYKFLEPNVNGTHASKDNAEVTVFRMLGKLVRKTSSCEKQPRDVTKAPFTAEPQVTRKRRRNQQAKEPH